MTDPSSIDSACDSRHSIGIGCDIVRVDDSIRKSIGWDTKAIDPDSGLEICKWEPANWTGYTAEAHVLDASGNVLEDFVVTPSVGDATGEFLFTIASSLVTQVLADAAVRWDFHLSFGDVRFTLVYAPFKVT